MKKNKGFTLVEVLVAMSILMMLIATILPIHTLLKKERKMLQDRRVIALSLHDNIQQIIWNERSRVTYSKTINHHLVTFTFTGGQQVKGCAVWTNEKQENEQVCLYGFNE